MSKADLLEAWSAHLRDGRRRSPHTVRAYVAAADRLLAETGIEDFAEVAALDGFMADPKHVHRFVVMATDAARVGFGLDDVQAAHDERGADGGQQPGSIIRHHANGFARHAGGEEAPHVGGSRLTL